MCHVRLQTFDYVEQALQGALLSGVNIHVQIHFSHLPNQIRKVSPHLGNKVFSEKQHASISFDTMKSPLYI